MVSSQLEVNRAPPMFPALPQVYFFSGLAIIETCRVMTLDIGSAHNPQQSGFTIFSRLHDHC